MRYEWKCNQCSKITEVTRSVDDRKKGPKRGSCCTLAGFERILSLPAYDWEHMRDKGILERLPM
jgi:hypothetical protein